MRVVVDFCLWSIFLLSILQLFPEETVAFRTSFHRLPVTPSRSYKYITSERINPLSTKATLFASVEKTQLKETTNKPNGILRLIWNATFGWLVALFSRIFRFLKINKEFPMQKDSIPREIDISVKKMKEISKIVDSEEARINDDVILVSTSISMNPADSSLSLPLNERNEIAVDHHPSLPLESKIITKERVLEQARKIVEKKLKEIKEQRKKQKLEASLSNSTDLKMFVSPYLNSVCEKAETGQSFQLLEETVDSHIPPTISSVAIEPSSVQNVAIVPSEEKLATPAIDEITIETNHPIPIETKPTALESKSKPESERTLLSMEMTTAMTPELNPHLIPSNHSKNIFSLEEIKAKGVSGVIAYTVTEAAFWAIYPLLIYLYHQSTGGDLTLGDSIQNSSLQFLGYSAIFVTIARFAIPLRLALAVSLIPWIDENITQRYLQKEEIGGP